MYEKLAKLLTNKIVKNESVDESKYDLYAYGFEILIAYIFYFVLFYIISAFTHTVIESTAFLIGFLLLRKFAGGFHASSYFKCHLLFAANHILFILVLKFLSETYYNILFVAVPVIMLVAVWTLAPVDNNNKRLNEREIVYFKKRSRVYSLIIVVATFALYVLDAKVLLMSYLFGILSASCSVFIGAAQERIKNNY